MTPEIEARLLSAKRLFVDVDDTLILWEKGSGGTTKWEPNHPIIAVVYSAQRQGTDVTFWSLGGEKYVQDRVLECPITLSDRWAYESKWPRIPEPGDLFIDDNPLPSFAAATIHPREFVEMEPKPVPPPELTIEFHDNVRIYEYTPKRVEEIAHLLLNPEGNPRKRMKPR